MSKEGSLLKHTVTLSDIAKKTGFSINTVSHALKDKPDISEKTKQLIRKTADELGYIINSSASFLRSGVSKNIAIILGDISNPHFSILVKEIEVSLREKGYTAFVFNTDEDEKLEKQAIVTALSKNVDGILLCPVQRSLQNIKFLQEAEIPFVLMGRWCEKIDTNYVVCDDENSGYLAAKHLLSKGHRKILCLSAPEYVSSAKERLHGVQRAFHEFGELFPEENVVYLHFGTGKRAVEIRKALQEQKGYTAVLCFSDVIAGETIYLLQEMGISVPEQISVMGFDNIQSKFLFPAMLTTFTSSKTKMSGKSVVILFHEMEHPDEPKVHLCLPTKLIERESTANRKEETK